MSQSQGPHVSAPLPRVGQGVPHLPFPQSPVLCALSCASPLPSSRSSPLQWIHAQVSPSSVAMQNNHQKEHLYKILVIGDLGVGKTSIIKRYVHHNFSPNYRATIGVDFALKVLNWDQETVRLQLWDIAGTVQYGKFVLKKKNPRWICDLFYFPSIQTLESEPPADVAYLKE